MLYPLIELGDTVRYLDSGASSQWKGKEGKVIAEGSLTNPTAHFLVRFSPTDIMWLSQDEVELVSKGG